MNKTWLLLDVDALAHRSWYAMGKMSYQGQETGALFGVLRDISRMQDMFQTPNIAFCFDQTPLLRAAFYPEYKANRNKEGKQSLYLQLALLRDSVLKDIGFTNIFTREGYEADDWLAFFCNKIKGNVVMVSRDHDLHQLLTEDNRVTMWDPQTKFLHTWEYFKSQWDGLPPTALPVMMSFIGCDTDNVKGIRGVGPETAIKLFRQEKVSPMLAQKVITFQEEGHHLRNEKLIRLPWPGLEEGPTDLTPDCVTQRRWNKVCSQYGMDSLVPNCPHLSPIPKIKHKHAGPTAEQLASWGNTY